ncbi:methyltransferase domain-containing protein [uncultured Algimonas sp.]|uniref:methyltransferase domain-containing protein n=1 Tax=uncultured Algimonas sp. TaxID=1547920 RepID=UPI00261FEB0D|nr:methyltransferase domain-containing protein [uncultured Algimonas sp.]
MKRPDATDPASFRYRLRKRRFRHVERIIRSVAAAQAKVTILDVGGRRDYWDYLPDDLRPIVSITLVNFEDELTNFAQKTDGLDLTTVVGDGCDMPQFADDSFDIVHSNSVIEHVGSLANMGRFAAETRRIGKRYYVQAPYLWFPIEPHYGVPILAWLPPPTRAAITHKHKVGYSDTPIPDYGEALFEADFINLPDKTLFRKLFPDAEQKRERFIGLTKSLIAVG